MKSRFILLLVFCCVFSAPASADLADARDALARGDAEAAAQEYTRLAEAGDAVAQAHLGYMYYTGEGVEQDYTRAVEWYRKAANQGNADARYNLAVAYAFGEGVEQDYGQAAKWYRMAADQGHAVAQYSLGLSYTYGEGVEQDYEQAVHWFEMAAAQDYAAASDALATLRQALAAAGKEQTEPAQDDVSETDGTTMPQSTAGVNALLDLKGIEPALPQTQQQPDEELLAAPASPERTAASESPRLPASEPEAPATASNAEIPAEPVDTDKTTRDNTGSEDRKESFLQRLFGTDNGETEDHAEAGEDTDPTAAETTAADEPEMIGTDEPASAPVTEEDTGPEEKKEGFLSRLFGSGSSDEDNGDEDIMAAAESDTDNTEEETPEENAESDDEAPAEAEPAADEEQGSFLGRLFGASDSSASGEELEDDSGVQPRNYDPALYERGMSALANDDYSAAVSAFREGADQGDPRAQYKLGSLYYQGLGVQQDYSRAMRWYELSAEAGNEDAQYSLGNMYFMGEGVEQSDTRAEYWYKKAAGQGHASARHNLSNLKRIMKSADAPPKVIKGEKQKKEKTEAGDAEGERPGFFKRLFSRGEEPEETINEAAVAGERKSGADVTEAASSVPDAVVEDYRKGMAHAFGDGVDKDREEAFNYFKRSAESGFAPAQYQLGVAYANGEGTEEDGQQALYWYREAAVQGHTVAQRNLGQMYMEGQGVEQDKIRALAWYSILAEAGNAMDIRQRDTLIRELSPKQIEESHYLKTALQSEIKTGQ